MEHVWNFYWVGGRCPCDPTYCPKTQTLDRPHFTDATTEASVLRTGHTASRGGFPAPTANPKTPRPASDHCAHCPRLGTESPALAVGTARARRRPPLCWGRRECPGQPAAAEGRAGAPRALALQPRAPRPRGPSPRRALTLRGASSGRGGVRGPEGAQQRAHRRRPASAPPAPAAHLAGGPLRAASAGGRRAPRRTRGCGRLGGGAGGGGAAGPGAGGAPHKPAPPPGGGA